MLAAAVGLSISVVVLLLVSRMYRCGLPTPSALPEPPANDGGLSKNSFVPSSEIAFVVVPNWLAARNDWARKLPFPRIAPSGLTNPATGSPAAWLLTRPVVSVMWVASGIEAIVALSWPPPEPIVTDPPGLKAPESATGIVVLPPADTLSPEAWFLVSGAVSVMWVAVGHGVDRGLLRSRSAADRDRLTGNEAVAARDRDRAGRALRGRRAHPRRVDWSESQSG